MNESKKMKLIKRKSKEGYEKKRTISVSIRSLFNLGWRNS